MLDFNECHVYIIKFIRAKKLSTEFQVALLVLFYVSCKMTQGLVLRCIRLVYLHSIPLVTIVLSNCLRVMLNFIIFP